MSALWRRLRRWLREPRIRLPAPGLSAAALAAGDRLQIGSRLWRLEARAASPDAAFELVAAEGPPDRARLVVAGGRWTLDAGGRALELDPAATIHYPVPARPRDAAVRPARRPSPPARSPWR